MSVDQPLCSLPQVLLERALSSHTGTKVKSHYCCPVLPASGVCNVEVSSSFYDKYFEIKFEKLQTQNKCIPGTQQ